MYTGIIQACATVVQLKKFPGLIRLGVQFPKILLLGLTKGASVSIDGVCLTVVDQQQNVVFFEAMQETLTKTTLGQLVVGAALNIERSARADAEIGGHLMSGHVDGMATIVEKTISENNHVMTFQPPAELMKYIFTKGFIGLDGASLTVVDANKKQTTFKVWFIPTTLELTGFKHKKIGDQVNIEIDNRTKVIVDTVLQQKIDLLG